MRKLAFAAVLAASPFAAQADVILNTSLPNVSGNFGGGTATTTTTTPPSGPPYGTVTTVAGPSGGANRATTTVVPGAWSQQNVGGNASVGITTNYADNGGGNGSAYFKGQSGDSKADLEIYFGRGYKLSTLGSVGYDWYRDSAGSAGLGDDFHPALRLILATAAGDYRGYLVYEGAYGAYSGAATAPTNQWVSTDIVGENVWATNGTVAALNPGYQYDFPINDFDNADTDSWAEVAGDLLVIGLSFGIGSGWNGPFEGAVDNVYVGFVSDNPLNQFDGYWNFEVAVPAPSALALFGAGLVALGALRRRRG